MFGSARQCGLIKIDGTLKGQLGSGRMVHGGNFQAARSRGSLQVDSPGWEGLVPSICNQKVTDIELNGGPSTLFESVETHYRKIAHQTVV